MEKSFFKINHHSMIYWRFMKNLTWNGQGISRRSLLAGAVGGAVTAMMMPAISFAELNAQNAVRRVVSMLNIRQ